jgi:hypothetical protein
MLVGRKNFFAQEITQIRIGPLHYLQIHRATLLRFLTAFALLVSAPVVGLLVVKVDPTLVLVAVAAPLGLVGLQFVVARPYLMPIAILMTGCATRWYFSKGITPALTLTALFTGIWLTQQMLARHRVELVKSPVMAPAVAIIAVSAISLFWGRAMADPLLIDWPGFGLIQLAQLAVLVLSPAALILTANLITTKQHLQQLVYAYIGITTIAIIADVARLPLRLNVDGLTSMWAVGLLYGQLLFDRKLPNLLRLAFFAAICLWLYRTIGLSLDWMSGWVPVFVSAFVITFIRSRKLFLILLILLTILVIASYSWWIPVMQENQTISADTRSAKWGFLFEPTTHSTWGHWFLGTGPFGYALYFMTYFRNNAASTHSNYIDIFLQLGVVGCVIFVWLFGALARVGYRLYRTPSSDGFIAGFVSSALGGLVAVPAAMYLGDWFTPFVFNIGLNGFAWTVSSWIFLGALAAVPLFLGKGPGKGREPLEGTA